MAEEQRPTHQAFQLPPLKNLLIDFQAGVLILEAETGATLTFAIGSSLNLAASPAAATTQTPAPVIAAEAQPATATEKNVVALTGKLKSKPKAGRPDSRGKPTTWCKLAVHEEGHEGARMYSTTFHRAAADQALKLVTDQVISVQGYVRPSSDPERMNQLSVFNILSPKL
jgi:hypothetical protein